MSEGLRWPIADSGADERVWTAEDRIRWIASDGVVRNAAYAAHVEWLVSHIATLTAVLDAASEFRRRCAKISHTTCAACKASRLRDEGCTFADAIELAEAKP